MEIISLYDTVTENGINISFEDLKKFLNQKVEITIIPVEEPKSKRDRMLELAGCLSDEDAQEILEAIKDCKTINYEDWDEIST